MVQREPLESGVPSLNPSVATWQLCDLRQVTLTSLCLGAFNWFFFFFNGEIIVSSSRVIGRMN